MTNYTVAADGSTTPDTFPQGTINDVLTPDGSYDQTTTTASVYISGGDFNLQSLFIGSSIEVDLGGGLFATGNERLTGTGNITGANDSTVILPAFVNYGVFDLNGTVAVSLTNYFQMAVSAGERLDIEGNLTGISASTLTVAAGAELDINSQTTAIVSALSSKGTLRVTAPTTTFSGATTLAGTVFLGGDATNGVGSGTQAARSTGNANGAYVATLDLRNASFSAPIANLTLGTDAQIRFGTDTVAVQRLAVTGLATALAPLDVVNLDGTVNVTGDGSGTANGIKLSQVEFTGGGTVDFAVAAADGGATLQGQVTVEGNTTLRNDGRMVVGGSNGSASVIGTTGSAVGSTLVNGSTGQLTIMAGAVLSVASIQNAGSVTVNGNATFFAPFAQPGGIASGIPTLNNSGTIDVAAGTLTLGAGVQGTGSINVENGATLSVGAATTNNIGLRTGGTLILSQPSTFAGTIETPGIGARIDLVSINATAARVSNGSIVVTSANGNFAIGESGLLDGTNLAIASDGAGGSLLTVSANTQPHPVAYRFFDSVHGTQFLTTSLTETQGLQASRPDLVYEGVGLGAANQSIDPAAAPVYRFFDTRFGTHFYTSSATERDDVIANRSDLVNEGVGFYEHNTAQAGDVAVYRFFDSKFGTHFYTSDSNERATVIATRPDLVAEGISFYAPTTT